MAVYIDKQRISHYSPFSFVERAMGEFFGKAHQAGFSGVTYAFWKKKEVGSEGVLTAPSLGMHDETAVPDWVRWSKTYMEALHALEPVFDACRKTVMPVCWGVDPVWERHCPQQPSYPTESMRQFNDCFQHTGIRNGIAVPIRGANGCFGYVSALAHCQITDEMWHKLNADHRMLGLGYEFFNKTSEYLDPEEENLPKLSARERQCLALAAKGLTLEETAADLGIARCTVRYHLENSICKLGVEKRAQAIFKATSLGLLNPL